MNKKLLAIFLIVFGGYLAVGNTIFSLIFNQVIYSGGGPIGDPIQPSPLNYWLNWWTLYGPITILIAAAGLILLYLGIRILIKDKQEHIKNVIITTNI
jgi:hypothetical protein